MPENKDLDKAVSTSLSLVPSARNASANGTGIDLAGYERTAVVVAFGTVTDGTHTPKIQESDDNSSFADVAAADQSGSFTAATTGGGNGGSATQEVGYLGSKRYIRAVITVTGATTGALVTAMAIRGGARTNPV